MADQEKNGLARLQVWLDFILDEVGHAFAHFVRSELGIEDFANHYGEMRRHLCRVKQQFVRRERVKQL